MRLELKKFFSGEPEAEQIDYAVDLSGVELDGEFPFPEPVRVTGTVSTTATGVLLDVTARYTLQMPCARCLTEVRRSEESAFRHILVREGDTESELSEDCIPVTGDALDLDELIYTDILLIMSAKVLCREDCKGLCPDCGKNLNDGPCGCKADAVDPRLEALRALLN